MNDHPDNAAPLDSMAASLQQLRPAPNLADASDLFYQAGIAAGRAQAAGVTRRRQALQMAAAALIGCAIAAPASFRLGQDSGAQAVAESESAGDAAERPATSPGTPAAEPTPPESAPRSVDEAAPATSVVESPKTNTAPHSVAAGTESNGSERSRPDFWQRWLQLETMLGSRLSKSPAAEQPLGHVLTASVSPVMLEQWLDDRGRFPVSNESSDHDRPHGKDSGSKVTPRGSTLSAGDAKRWVDLTRGSLKVER